jgi:hypothetical protein
MPPKPKLERHGQLIFHSAAEFVLLLRSRSSERKIARISFGKDGSIYVQFPYCIQKSGWIGELPVPADPSATVTYSLRSHGSFVDTDVKFSHHRSGIALFSKTGLELPPTRRNSFRLDGPIGHLFRLQVSNPQDFAELKKIDKTVKYLALDFPDDGPTSISWRAEWRRKASLIANIQPPSGTAGPKTSVQHRVTGAVDEVLFLGQPPGYALRDHVLLLTGGPSPRPAGVTGSGMTFLGGWDEHEVQSADEKPVLRGALAFVYPAHEPSPADP